MIKANPQKGFTLLEIMIALLVISMALGAIISTSSHSFKTESHVKNKILASWIASNHLNEMSIMSAWPDSGNFRQQLISMGRSWHLEQQVKQTSDPNLRQIKLSIYATPEYSIKLYELHGWLENPTLLDR